MKQITITKNDAGQRLDKFLSKFMPALPKSMLYKSLRKNCVRINGCHEKNGAHMLCEGDVLYLYFRDEFFEKKKEKIFNYGKIDVVYEDENILIVNKPAGLLVHADADGTTDTLIGRIHGYLYQKGEYDPDREQSFTPALCNRIDRNTEGLVIAAKNAPALRIINEKIKRREIKKYYLCITEGVPPKNSDTLIGALTRGDRRVTVGEHGDKEIQTRYTVLEKNDAHALLKIELLTGRTHQIRAQLAQIGCPLAGDTKYGATRTREHYRLCSFKIVFDLITDAGEMNYLNGKRITIDPGYVI